MMMIQAFVNLAALLLTPLRIDGQLKRMAFSKTLWPHGRYQQDQQTENC